MSVQLICFDTDFLMGWPLSSTCYQGAIFGMTPVSFDCLSLCRIYMEILLHTSKFLVVLGLRLQLTFQTCHMSIHSACPGF